MAMIFQDPLSALHPYFTMGHQISEAYLIPRKVGNKAAWQHAIDMLGRVAAATWPENKAARRPAGT